MTKTGARQREDELRLSAPDTVSTVRVLPCAKPRCVLVFLHGLLGDSYSWNVFNHHQQPSEYADCYYVDFSFETLRVEALSFHLLVREVEQLMLQIIAASPAGLPVVLVGQLSPPLVLFYVAATSYIYVGIEELDLAGSDADDDADDDVSIEEVDLAGSDSDDSAPD